MFNFIKRHKLFILFLILFFISLSIYSSNIKSRTNLNGFQRLILNIILPVQRMLDNIKSSFFDSIDNYIMLIDVKQENIKLKKKIDNANAKIEQLKEYEIENERLRKLLDFKLTLKEEVIPAEVISKGASEWIDTIIIDKGSNHGVIPGLAVVTEKGVVGHTIYTTNNYAQVLLMIDKNSAVAVINQRSRAKGIVKGFSDNLCKIEYTLSKENVEVDDKILTSGMDGIFPKGLLVGKVTDVKTNRYELFKDTTLEPYVDFDKLEEVLIIMKKEELLDEIDSIKRNENK